MTELHDRFRSLDRMPAPDLWSEISARTEGEPAGHRFSGFGLAATVVLSAIVIVFAVLLLRPNVAGPGPIDSPVPTPSAPAATPGPTSSLPPGVSALPGGTTDLAAGSYLIGDPFPLNVTLTVPDGWTVWFGTGSDGAALYQLSPDPPGGHGLIVTAVENVYADACQLGAGVLSPQLGPTVEDLATALANQPFTQSSAAEAATLDGYDGTYLDYRFNSPGTSCPDLYRWSAPRGPRQALNGERDQVWILDVDGFRLVIDAFSFSGATDADLAEVRDVVESIQIEPRGGS